MKIFIIDDDSRMLRQLEKHLKDIATFIRSSNTYDEALDILLKERFDCIVCDYELSLRSGSKNGIHLLHEIRDEGVKTPFILLTSKNEQVLRSWDALNGGTDDFIKKPYTPQELVARILCVCRRMNSNTQTDSHNILACDEMVLDLESRKLYVSGKEVLIRKTPFLLLVKLIRNKGKLLSYSLLQEYIWGKVKNPEVEEKHLNVLRVHMFNLKNTLEKQGLLYLQNIHGSGYKFLKE